MRQNTNPDDLRQYLCKSCDRTGWITTNEKGDRIEFANGLHDKITDEPLIYTGVRMCSCLIKIRQGDYSPIHAQYR